MGMNTGIKIGDSIELIYKDIAISVGILATTKGGVTLDITAPKEVLIKKTEVSHAAVSRAEIKRRAEKKKAWELLNGKREPVDKFAKQLKELSDYNLVNSETNIPEEEIAVAKEMQ